MSDDELIGLIGNWVKDDVANWVDVWLVRFIDGWIDVKVELVRADDVLFIAKLGDNWVEIDEMLNKAEQPAWADAWAVAHWDNSFSFIAVSSIVFE